MRFGMLSGNLWFGCLLWLESVLATGYTCSGSA